MFTCPRRALVTIARRSCLATALLTAFTSTTPPAGAQAGPERPSPGTVVELKAVRSLSPAVVGQFREPIAFQQAASGEAFVFDRRGHAVFAVSPDGTSARKIVEIGGETGRVITPTAFGLHESGLFAVTDAPNGRERVQVFGFGGQWLNGFLLPGRATTRVTIDGIALNGVGSLVFTGRTVLLNLPETGSLVTEFGLGGTPVRSIGSLRPTGQEDDRELHLALNTAIPLAIPGGGHYVVFVAGTPTFRRYDAKGTLLFERIMQGQELDGLLAQLPKRWPRRAVGGTEVPLVTPVIRAAAVDGRGRLWVSLTMPVTYVFDDLGEKVRTVRFRGAGVIAPTSLSFTSANRLLVTPGCYEFAVD